MYNFTPMLFPEVINFTLLVYMLGLHFCGELGGGHWNTLYYMHVAYLNLVMFGTRSLCTCGINIYMPGNDE